MIRKRNDSGEAEIMDGSKNGRKKGSEGSVDKMKQKHVERKSSIDKEELKIEGIDGGRWEKW